MHFTFQTPKGDLQQGDVIRRTAEIDAVLAEVHPHYCKQDYKLLIVLTQSCDLVRRSPCKARYISLAAVRPLDLCLTRELAKHQRSERERQAGYCSADARERLVEFAQRLLNNNEPAYFYLHTDPELGLPEPHVAFLALSIAVKADLHYEKCLASRIAQLKPEFQSKLGWLVGNMYSRVGTPDWAPDNVPVTDFQSRVDAIVNGLCLWVDDRFMSRLSKDEKRLRKERGEAYRLTRPDVEQLIESYKADREKRKEQIAERALAVARALATDTEGRLAQAIERALREDDQLGAELRQPRTVPAEGERRRGELAERVLASLRRVRPDLDEAVLAGVRSELLADPDFGAEFRPPSPEELARATRDAAARFDALVTTTCKSIAAVATAQGDDLAKKFRSRLLNDQEFSKLTS